MARTEWCMIFKYPPATYTPEHYWDLIEYNFLAYFHYINTMESVSLKISIVGLFAHKNSQDDLTTFKVPRRTMKTWKSYMAHFLNFGAEEERL